MEKHPEGMPLTEPAAEVIRQATARTAADRAAEPPLARPADPPPVSTSAPAAEQLPPPATPVVVPASQGPLPVDEPGQNAPGNEVAVRGGTSLAPAGDHWLTHRDLQLDPDSRVVRVGGDELELTRTEFDLLATLLESKRRVRSKADLTLVLRGESYVTSYFVGEADKRAIEAHMTNLRRKLGDNPANPRYIETVRGVGYRLTSELMAAP